MSGAGGGSEEPKNTEQGMAIEEVEFLQEHYYCIWRIDYSRIV